MSAVRTHTRGIRWFDDPGRRYIDAITEEHVRLLTGLLPLGDGLGMAAMLALASVPVIIHFTMVDGTDVNSPSR